MPRLFLGAIVAPLIAAAGVRADLIWTPIIVLVLGIGAILSDADLCEKSVRRNSVSVSIPVGNEISLSEEFRQRAGQPVLSRMQRADEHEIEQLAAERRSRRANCS